MHNLSEAEANRLLTRLQVVAIAGEKVKQADGKWSVEVEHSDALNAIRYLDEVRVFKDVQRQEEDKSSFLSSREEQHYRHAQNLGQEIEATLLSIKGVLDARVHLNLPETDPILGHRLSNSKGSGSVLLVVSEEFINDSQLVSRLVSGAAGLEDRDISLLISRERNISRLQAVHLDPVAANAISQPTLVNGSPPINSFKTSNWWSSLLNIASFKEWGLWIFASFLFVTGVIALIIGKRSHQEFQESKFSSGLGLYDSTQDLH